eukprot:TRINITY_DN59757_c0_g1_i2.p1 TRINITY_DN59757_c0_g1~~TRINITY_DN59757_c0_g1_i2.p1  ORF type:complete len:266 (+),score=20.80 TRINITY_DN59757_c0_g1_i2:63-860(+)
MAAGGPIVDRLRKRFLLLAASLSFLSGFVDVITLIRFGEFAALQTGNMVFIGRSLSQLSQQHEPIDVRDIGDHVATLFSNFSGVFLFCAIQRLCKRPVLVAAPILACLTLAGGLVDLLSYGAEPGKWGACLIAASMGATNFVSSPNSDLGGKLFAMTSLATGNLQKSAKMFFKLASCQDISVQEKQETYTAVSTVLATVGGAAAGGLALSLSHSRANDYTSSWYFLIVGPLQCAILVHHDYLLRPLEVFANGEQAGDSLSACVTP